MPWKSYKVFCFLSMGCFFVSLFLPVFQALDDKVKSGWYCLTSMPGDWFWAANPICFATWISILLRRPFSILGAAAALVCAIGGGAAYAQWRPWSTLMAGYWVWTIAMLLTVIAAADLLHASQSKSDR